MSEQTLKSIFPFYTNDAGYNQQVTMISNFINRMAICTLVKVIAIDEPNMLIDVQPLVTQVDAYGQPVSNGIIYNIPYFQYQGGTSGIILTPAVNDIGLCVFCHNDISTVKKTKKEALPATLRRNSHSDGIYIGGVLNAPPTQYIEFTAEGINIVTDGAVSITSATLTHNGKNIGDTHTHSGVQTGSGNTGAPN